MNNPEKLATFAKKKNQKTEKPQKTQHNMCWTPLYASKHK